jgi:hypothetical protein
MADALESDSTSQSEFIFSKEDHAKVKQLTQETTLKDSLRAAAKFHRAKFEQYEAEFKSRYPGFDVQQIYLNREEWMVDEIWNQAEPMADPVLRAK